MVGELVHDRKPFEIIFVCQSTLKWKKKHLKMSDLQAAQFASQQSPSSLVEIFEKKSPAQITVPLLSQ